MAGGKAERLGNIEKPILKICGKPIIKHIIDEAIKITDKIYVASSPNTPSTTRWCLMNNVNTILTPGENYPLDLRFILKKFKKPILFLPADIPFITGDILHEFLDKALEYDESIITLIASRNCFPNELSGSKPSPLGISLFNHDEMDSIDITMCKFPELLDIDTYNDLKYALEYMRRLCI